TINILDEKIYYLDFYDQPVNSFTIMKYDADTREPLADATFRVTKLGAVKEIIGEYITDANGKITIVDLLPGSYEIEEIKAPKNYVLDRTVQTIALEQNKPQVVTFYDYRYGDLLITKINNKTKAPIEDVKFKITKQDGTFVGEYITDTDGYISVSNLDPGFYIVQETECPNEYVRDITPKTVEIKSNQLQTIQFVNKPKSRVYLRKLDTDTGTGVQGAVITVEKGSTLIGTFTSGFNGEVEVGLLDPGDYVFTEITPPPNYSLNGGTNDIQRMTITDTDEVTVTFQNRAYGNMMIIKRNEFSNLSLAGAEFTVSYANGAFYGNYTTMSDGTILIPNIEPGIYLIRETRAPNGYMLDNAAKTVTMPAVVTTEVVFLNRPKSGIQIVKVDKETRGALSGAEFKVTRANGEVIGIKTTDIGGNAIFDDLEPGTYIVTETRAPDGYVLDATSQTVVVTSDKITTVNFENRPYSGIQIIKKNSVTGTVVAGAEFRVTKTNGETVGSYTTDSSGTVIVENLVPGSYVITETKAPQFYVLNSTPQTIEVKSGKLAAVEFMNTPYGNLVLTKTDRQTGIGLEGAVFEVKKASGEMIGRFTTGAGGIVIVQNLVPGTYIVTEIQAPSGYEIDTPPQTLQVGAGSGTGSVSSDTGYPEGSTSLTFVSNNPLGTLEVVKLDKIDRHTALEGATFELRKADGTYVDTQITDISGKAFFGKLPSGNYVITETVAPRGYDIDTTAKNVTITAGSPVSVTFYDNPKSGLQIVKIDANTKQPLKGAKFTIYRMDGGIVGSFETNGDGVIIIGQLEAGWYKVAESKAPEGYLIDDTPQDFEVTSAQFIKLVFEDKPLASLQIKKTDELTGAPLAGAQFK
ncbi:MAG: SpaA isopeptide-forming pilin-related protein, partial [Oscillospiraceae bacterium]|nr:SpaA isopeptide-forming pilin-related protein [Oscillospiraceae bacterium]